MYRKLESHRSAVRRLQFKAVGSLRRGLISPVIECHQALGQFAVLDTIYINTRRVPFFWHCHGYIVFGCDLSAVQGDVDRLRFAVFIKIRIHVHVFRAENKNTLLGHFHGVLKIYRLPPVFKLDTDCPAALLLCGDTEFSGLFTQTDGRNRIAFVNPEGDAFLLYA